MRRILYIYCSEQDVHYSNLGDDVRLYCLGTGKLLGRNISIINDSFKLNEIATNNAKDYSEFVFEQNKLFLDSNMIYEDKLSLYFLTDFSCKRSEIFPTYSIFCNALFIKNYLIKNQIDKVIFDGCEVGIVESMRSVIGDTDFTVLNSPKYKPISIMVTLMKNVNFFFKLLIAKLIEPFLPIKQNSQDTPLSISKLFLTRYPLHLNDELYEDKFADLIDPEDIFLVNLFADGLHQNLSIGGFIAAKKKLSSKKRVIILDDYLSMNDVLKSFIYSIYFLFKLKPLTEEKFSLKGISLNSSIKKELFFATIRVPRLLMWQSPLRKFLSHSSIEKVFYYLHEYSYGRMITFFFKSIAPLTQTIGYQHGPSSLRKMVYMAASNELSIYADGKKSFPIPDMILAEDQYSRNIYIAAGYQNVQLMKKIFRLGYLSNIDRSKINRNHHLIAPGLHDGEFLMNALLNQIKMNSDILYFLKLHPRANNNYAERFKDISNLSIFDGSIVEALEIVDKVYATYSSVAIEACYLGIEFEIVEIPGKINESPIIDKEFLKNISY